MSSPPTHVPLHACQHVAVSSAAAQSCQHQLAQVVVWLGHPTCCPMPCVRHSQATPHCHRYRLGRLQLVHRLPAPPHLHCAWPLEPWTTGHLRCWGWLAATLWMPRDAANGTTTSAATLRACWLDGAAWLVETLMLVTTWTAEMRQKTAGRWLVTEEVSAGAAAVVVPRCQVEAQSAPVCQSQPSPPRTG